MDNFTYYHIPPVRHLRLKLIEFLHSFGLNVICHVNVWLHCFVIAMPSPLHDYLGRNTQRQRITNERPTTAMGADKLIFRLHLVNTFISFIEGQTYWFIDLRQFTEVVKVGVHLLVANDRQNLVVLKLCILVFLQDGSAVLVQFNGQTIRSLYRSNLNTVFLYIAFAQV